MKIRFTYILALSLLVASCNKEQTFISVEDDKKNSLTLTTRAETATEDFADDSELRLALFDSGTTTPYLVEANNFVHAQKSDNNWLFSLDEGSTKSAALGYLKDDTKSIEIVGVYPYITDNNLAQVTINKDTQKPFMWAKSKSLSLNNDNLNADLYFQHIMSALYFDMTLKNSADGVTLTRITLKLYDKEGKLKPGLPLSATIDFLNSGYLSDIDKRNTIEVSQNINFTSPNDDGRYELQCYLYMPPFEMEADDVLEVSFMFDIATPTINNSIKITGADLEGRMERGVRYTIPIEISNYLKFNGTITKTTEWGDADIIYKDI